MHHDIFYQTLIDNLDLLLPLLATFNTLNILSKEALGLRGRGRKGGEKEERYIRTD